MSDDDCWDVPDENNAKEDSEEVLSDWDIDSDELDRRKAEEEKKLAEAKAKQKTIKQKIKEKEEEEQRKRAARIAEANRVKSEGEKQRLREKQDEDIINDELGADLDDLLDFDDDTDQIQNRIDESSAKKTQPSGDSSISNFKPKTKNDMDKLSDMFVNLIYSHSKNTQFNYLLEQTCKKMGERQDFKNFESVKLMGRDMQRIGNDKHNEFKKSTTKKKGNKKSKGISIAKGGGDLENMDDYNDDDDFM